MTKPTGDEPRSGHGSHQRMHQLVKVYEKRIEDLQQDVAALRQQVCVCVTMKRKCQMCVCVCVCVCVQALVCTCMCVFMRFCVHMSVCLCRNDD